MKGRASRRRGSALFLLTVAALLPLVLVGRGAPTTSTLWPATAVPSVPADTDTSAVEIGLKFRADVSGYVTAIRFYKASTNTGTHVGHLWTSTGTLLATATFTNETTSGWQQVSLASPVAIAANAVYVVSYHAPRGHYAGDNNYFSSAGVDSPPLHALADGVSGGNGVYIYGPAGGFPNQTWMASNYWVDVVFSTDVAPDTVAPTVTAFTVPGTSPALNVPITAFTATDNVAVTGYLATESATPPSPTAAGWSATAPTSYVFGTAGAKTLYGWAKDAAGNVSASRSASVTITLPDTTSPTVTAFTIPAATTTLAVPITTFTATDNVAVTGYLVNESPAVPSPTAAGWTASAPGSYTFATAGTKTVYAWAKDGAGNVSTSKSASVTITLPDSTAPTVTAFTIPTTATTLTVPITAFTATDNVAVTGYLVNESPTAPSPTAAGWSVSAATSYVFASAGTKTLYAWAKDAAGNVSASRNATVTITLDTTSPTVTAFTVPPSVTTLAVPITTFTATDNVAVTGYLVTESSAAPAPTAAGWTAAAPGAYACATAGDKTLFAWAKDAAGNVSPAVSAPVTITLSSSSIWAPTAVPTVPADTDTSAVELGVKFKADVAGYITAIRFYKASTNTGTHVGHLWSSTGTRLATVTFTNETTSGWQQANLAAPVGISANTVYVVSYLAPRGHYSGDNNFFAGAGVDNPPLHALADGASGGNGVYVYGSSGGFPNQSWMASNYWVDVVFTSDIAPDTTPPTVTAFTIPGTSPTLVVPITAFTATDNVAVTGYLATESATPPSPTAAGWSATAPTSYAFGTAGAKTLYGWARDAAGNVSPGTSASVTIALTDTQPPTVTAFTIPSTATTLTVPITAFTATDNVGVAGYLVRTSPDTPLPTDAGWAATTPTSYTFTSAGTKTLYAWAKDGVGNVSTSLSDSVTITLTSTGPEPPGWFAGDMHVHRSCGGSPESISSMASKMATNNLAVISLLADMGNGEVQNPTTDLPRVTGGNDPVSTPGRIVHWDAEWHWDATYGQYAHQALGGHVVALGLREAHQIWAEGTDSIFNWAHQQNGIAGFAHMQYLDGGMPSYLTCCTPIEFPVEVALGRADFIEEDVAGSEAAIGAYYRLLNSGFRPSLAAGTDYPCNHSEPLGSLLTYVQVTEPLTYAGWIDGIKKGRTVVSTNAHNEYLLLTVNGTAMPGDEIKLTGGGSVQVDVQWTAAQNLSGTIELVQNGVVVASKNTSAGPGAPATLGVVLDFARSGWLVARRMDSGQHKVHTGAVFVSVDNAPVRASREDALYFVQWIDTLLQKIAPGGEWNWYFPTTLAQTQARYQAARALYAQIAQEADPGTAELPLFAARTRPSWWNVGSAFAAAPKTSAPSWWPATSNVALKFARPAIEDRRQAWDGTAMCARCAVERTPVPSRPVFGDTSVNVVARQPEDRR